MIGYLILPAILFLVAVVFYRQRRDELSILQIEQEQINAQLSDLLDEQQPLVLRGVAPPKGLTKGALEASPRLHAYPVGGILLKDVLANPSTLASTNGAPTLLRSQRRMLAEELSLPIWSTHTWKDKLGEARPIPFLGSMDSEAIIGGQGLWRTTAVYTLLFPTEGAFIASIVSKSSEAFLPKAWTYRYPDTFTQDDTPLVADLKFIDIILRPGTALCLPAHILVSMKPKEPSEFHAFACIEYHEPISMLAKSLS
jgi:hypothetical protein